MVGIRKDLEMVLTKGDIIDVDEEIDKMYFDKQEKISAYAFM